MLSQVAEARRKVSWITLARLRYHFPRCWDVLTVALKSCVKPLRLGPFILALPVYFICFVPLFVLLGLLLVLLVPLVFLLLIGKGLLAFAFDAMLIFHHDPCWVAVTADFMVLATVAFAFAATDGDGAVIPRATVVVVKPRHGYSELVLDMEWMFQENGAMQPCWMSLYCVVDVFVHLWCTRGR
jgi:hypothetical protein